MDAPSAAENGKNPYPAIMSGNSAGSETLVMPRHTVMIPSPMTASRPDPQRSSAYGSTSTTATATLDSPVAPFAATIRATSHTISVPNATATAANGWVRRQSVLTASTVCRRRVPRRWRRPPLPRLRRAAA
jgi:hypothetical protein